MKDVYTLFITRWIMKKLPYGISNYEELITENYYYVDKTNK